MFDRVTGKPVWPIEERAVPQSDVPGEKTSPTQPFPTKPPAYARASLKIPDDLIDFTPGDAQRRHRAAEALSRGGDVHAAGGRRSRTSWLGGISMGNASGGTNWAGGGYDPETHIVYVQAANVVCAHRSRCASRRMVLGYSTTSPGRNDQPFRVMEGPGFGSAADARKRGGRGRGGWRRRRRCAAGAAAGAAPAHRRTPAAAAAAAAGGLRSFRACRS